MNRRHVLAAVAAALVLLTACGGTDTEPDPDDLPPTDTGDEPDGNEPDDPGQGDEPPTDDGDAAGSDPLLGPEIEIAMDDLVDRAGIEREQVEILVTELVTWPDGALGCPEPGAMYTQALVDGYRIVLSVDGDEYHYHGASGADPEFCADPTTDGATDR